jgi:hypothetical protein
MVDLSKYIIEKQIDGKIVLIPFDVNNYDVEEQTDGKIILSLKKQKLKLVEIQFETITQLTNEYIAPFMQHILSAQYEDKLNYLKDRMTSIYDLVNDEHKKQQFRYNSDIISRLENCQQYHDTTLRNAQKHDKQKCYDINMLELNNLINFRILETQLCYMKLCYKL